MSSLLSADQVHRTAAILEGILEELSWPEDAEHILHIQSTLDIIQTGTFRKLALLAEKGVVLGPKEPSCSKVPSSQVPLSASTAPEPSNHRLVSTSDGLEEGAAFILPSPNRDEGVSPSTDVVKEGRGEHVPLSMLNPSEGARLDSGIHDSVIMKERVLTDPFLEYDVEVTETSFSQNMMEEIEKRMSDSRLSSPATSPAESPLHQPLGGGREGDTDFKVNDSQVTDVVSPVKEGWLPGEDCVRQATEQLGAFQASTIPEEVEAMGEECAQLPPPASVDDDVFGKDGEGEGDGPVDVLFPMRSKESLLELQQAVLRNQISISALQSPDGRDDKLTWEL